MLTEQRYQKIMDIVYSKKTVTVLELVQKLGISESTVRRDLVSLDKLGKLIRVHGGATSLELQYETADMDISKKSTLNLEQKHAIGKYASSLIMPGDFVYLDAGTTVEIMAGYITEKNANYVTNSVWQAKALSKRDISVTVIGGTFKAVTEAIIGSEAVECLQKYHFTKGFFGTNGISDIAHFSTPEANEASVKRTAITRCKQSYVLADSTKFDKVSAVTFGYIENSTIITTQLAPRNYNNTIYV